MPRIPLLGGAYQSRSLIASAQRCVNLYPESNPPEGSPPVPVTHYPTPGLDLLVTPDIPAPARSLYTASNGDLFAVIGNQAFYVTNQWQLVLLGSVTDMVTPVSMADNGLVLVLVNGTGTGYCIDLATHAFGIISAPDFFGGTFVAYIDTYFVFDIPGTREFYISVSLPTYGMLTQTSAPIYAGSVTAAGGSYTNGSYADVALTGGTGLGARGTIVVSGNVVTSVTITTPGDGYAVGDVLSANAADIGGTGSGFTWTVSLVQPAFDSLDVAAKTGGADPLQTIVAVHNELWLIGSLTSEVWTNTGAADFTFERISGAFIDHGNVAKYSVATADILVFWLTQDRQGRAIIVKSRGYGVERISTHAIEAEIQSYSRIDDARAFCHQLDGHAFYVIFFPTADKTWAYEIATSQWHERASIDGNGVLHRNRANCFAAAYGVNVVGDYQNGKLYNLDPLTYTDNGIDIPRIRTFPHMIQDGNRVSYKRFIADIEVGQASDILVQDAPQASLRFSNNRGATYGNATEQSLGSGGQYGVVATWWNPGGVARDGVFELSWAMNANTALNGAFLEFEVADT